MSDSIELFFWMLVIGLVVYEFLALYWSRAPDDHITAIFRRLNRRPLIPFVVGFLAGHIFW